MFYYVNTIMIAIKPVGIGFGYFCFFLFTSIFSAGCREEKIIEVSMNELKMNEEGRYSLKGRSQPFSGIAIQEKKGKRIIV